jgi:tripartite-type tricarboxylate transporter receptor subunit TctC
MTMASQGNGSIGHLAQAVLARRADLRFTHVPTAAAGRRGGCGGRACRVAARHPARRDRAHPRRPAEGARRLLGRPQRRATDVPTIAESGFDGFDIVTWQGILAPAGTPRPVVARLHAVLTEALRCPEVGESLRNQGFDLTGTDPTAFATLVREEAERWPGVVRPRGGAAGLRVAQMVFGRGAAPPEASLPGA